MSESSSQDKIWNAPIIMLAGAALGAVLVLAALALNFWGEHKAIKTAISLEQGASNVQTVAADKVDSGNDGKLVHLTGDAAAGEPVTDPELGVSTKGLNLKREVEMYQWKETKTVPKGKDAKPTYSYKPEWSKEKPVTKFNDAKAPSNPDKKPFDDGDFPAKEVKVGAFTLSSEQVKKIPTDENLAITAEQLAKLPNDVKARAKVDPEGRLYVGNGAPDQPAPGDARIRYKIAKPQTVSLVAKQKGDTFEPFVPDGGEEVNLIKAGSHGASAMFEGAQTSGKVGGWLFRVLAFVIATLGIYLVLRRQASVASGEPPNVGAEVGAALLAGCLAVPLVMLVIGIRWITHQAGYGAGMFGLGAVLLAGVVVLARRTKSGPFAGMLGGGGAKWSETERDYFRRIAIEPENTKLRLEFAKHLEKNGNPLGEFIRLDHELEAIPEGDAERERVDRRWTQLLNLHGGVWYRGLRSFGLYPHIMGTFYPSLWMNHGIIEKVVLDLPGILPEKAEKFFEAVPGLRILDFSSYHGDPMTTPAYEPDIPGIVEVPQMSQVGVLVLSSILSKIEDVRAIAASPYMENLQELDLSAKQFGPEMATLIAKSTTLKRLRVLSMSNALIGDAGAALLAASPNVAHMVELSLSFNELGPKGAAALAGSPHLKNLKKLNLSDNKIGPVGVSAIVNSPHLRELTVLELNSAEMGGEGIVAVAKSPNMAKLTTLKLSANKLGGPGVRVLVSSPHLGRLEILDLASNAIDDGGIAALAASKVILKLKELVLYGNNIGDAGAAALANWPGLAPVTKLNFYENKLTAEGVRALAESPHVRAVEELDLSNNNVGVGGARSLATSKTLTSIKYLTIREANLTPEGEQMLRKRFGDTVHFD